MHSQIIKRTILQIQQINIGAEKFDSTSLETFEIVIALFKVKDKKEMSQFLEKTFSLIKFSTDVALGMSYFTLKNVKVNFLELKHP